MENIGQTKTVLFEGQQAPINLLPAIKLDGYQIKPFTLEGEAKNRASGAFFKIPPLSYTAVAKIIEPGVQLSERISKGMGWFLSVSPEGKVKEMIIEDNMPMTLEYGTGYAFCYFAWNEGLTIQNLTWPPFRPEMEKIIPENSKELPKEFWGKYQERFTSHLFPKVIRRPTQK